MRLPLLVMVVSCAFCAHVAVGAEDWNGSRTVQVHLNNTNFINNSGLTTSGTAPGGELVLDFQTDWTMSTSLFTLAELDAPAVTYTRSEYVTTGPGQTELIELEIVSDPLSGLSARSLGNIPMSPGTQGRYDLDVANLRKGQYGQFDDITLTGTWEIRGPTETKSGTFSLPAFIQPEYCFPAYDYIGTSGYPTSIQLVSARDQLLWETKLSPNYFMVEEVVNGVPVKFKVNGLYFIGMTTTLTPEPSALVMLVSAGALIVMKRNNQRVR